jgi:hypothetical protein
MSFVDVAQGAAPMNVAREHLVSQPSAGKTLRPAHLAPKTQPMIWFPAACLFYWGEITRNEILLDAARRDERRKIQLTASELARRVGLDTSDGREAVRALLARGIWRREGNELITCARKEFIERHPDAGDFDVPILAEVAKKVWPRCQSALVIRAHLAVCWHQRARQRGTACAFRRSWPAVPRQGGQAFRAIVVGAKRRWCGSGLWGGLLFFSPRRAL